MRRLCKERFVSFVRVREWQDIHQQLRQIVGEMPAFAAKPQAAKTEAPHGETALAPAVAGDGCFTAKDSRTAVHIGGD